MSTYSTAYCSEADVQSILPNIADYDRKRTLTGWSTYSGSVYQCGSTGSIDMLYRDGLEMGTVQANLGALNADKEWWYDSSLDTLYFYSTNAPGTSHIMEGGKDWNDTITMAINRASQMVDSIVGKPIYPRKGVGYQGLGARDYDEVIILSTAGIAASLLVAPYNRELAIEIESKWNNEETGLGVLQLIRSGNIKMHHEIGKAESEGVIQEVSLGGSTTGGFVDIKGEPTVSWDLIKVIISTGGTFTAGTANTSVKFSTYVGDDTGLKMALIASAEIIDGNYQYIGRGLYGKFSPGVFTTNDEWEVECSGDLPESHNIKFAQAVR